MTAISVHQYQQLNNQLRQVPREQLAQFCKEKGFRSWFTNANRNENYPKYAHLANRH